MTNNELLPFQIISAAACAADSRTPVFQRFDYQAINFEYVTEGVGYLEEDGHSWKLEKGDVYILKKHKSHCYWHDKNQPWHKIFIVVNGFLAEEIVRQHIFPETYVFRECEPVKSYFETMLSLVRSPFEPKNACFFHNLVWELGNRFQEKNDSSHAKPEQRLLEKLENCVNESFSLERYANQENYSTSYLIRMFKNAYGTTPCEYLIEKKIRHAEDLLRYTDLQIKEIADQLAFSDQGTFSRCFHQRLGISPREYRQTFINGSR